MKKKLLYLAIAVVDLVLLYLVIKARQKEMMESWLFVYLYTGFNLWLFIELFLSYRRAKKRKKSGL